MKEIELRADTAAEYKNLLHDCCHSYVGQRGLLLTSSVHSSLAQITQQHSTDSTALVRAGCDFMCRVCQDEYQLYFHFFSVDSPELKGLLESLCYTLYDVLRPVVIHINHLETLADLCSILKVEMLEEIVSQKGQELAVFGTVVRQLLGDAQQRIVFRAQRYIQTDIRGYSPAPGDLAYPDKLVVAGQVVATEAGLDPDTTDSDSVFDTSGTESDTGGGAGRRRKGKRVAAVDMHDMWYPTVRRTLLCLSKLYRCIDKSIFEGIAQEALSECVKSLCSASGTMASKKPSVDAQLFLIKHLLILREQIAAFDVEFAVTEFSLDWTKTTAAMYELLKKKSRLFSFGSNNAFLEFFLEGVPGLLQTQMDSKKEVDVQLKAVCERFISDMTSGLTVPLKDFLAKCDVIFQLAEKDRLDPASTLLQQPFAKADEVHQVVVQGNKLIKTKVPALRQSLALYLANEETEHILFRPVKASVLQAYEALERIAVRYYSTSDQFIISTPTQDQVSLMLALTQDQDHTQELP
ncbi:Conserved oligomeric Golgi complex subunit 3 [Geodia barretti]|nr:Conserved oligomeric Golgi complex subunit 3 [Geodia barretti]